MIQLINVNKGYEDRIILEDLNLLIEPGTVLGLVGPNGAGKSTILRLISGVIQADAGIVAVNEYEIFDNDRMKESIFFLGDDPYFFNQSTIRDMKEYIKLFYHNFDEDFYQKLLSDFNISDTVMISSFSKGMKRQAALIVAMASRPQILLMDESFDGLDPMMRFQLKQNIVEQLDKEEMIVIISSHSMSEIEDICDTVLLVKDRGIALSEKMDTIHLSYHKFQIAFKEKVDLDILKALNPITMEGHDRIFTLIIKGEYEELKSKVQALNPLVMEHSNLSLDEIYRYEMGGHQ